MRSVLIVKLGAIGDVVMLIPAAHAMHRAGYRVDWVCGRTVLPLLELYEWIHPIAVDERVLLTGGTGARARVLLRLWRQLRVMGESRRYDVVATMYYDRRYRLVALPVRAKRRVSLSLSERGRRLLPGRHHTDEYARILLGLKDEVRPEPLAPVRVDRARLPKLEKADVPRRPPFGRPAGSEPDTGWEPGRAEALPYPEINREPQQVVIAPGGARNLLADDALRRWPLENYVELARRLRERGVGVTVIGGAEDAWVTAHFAGVEVVDCVGRLSLPETLTLLDSDVVLVTHDTGPLHLGGITGAGVVGIFGPTDPRGRMPQRAGTVGIWGGEGFACRPCYDGQHYAACPANDCVRQVTVEMVLGEAMEMLEARAKGVKAAPRVMTPDSTVRGEGLVVIRGGKH